MLLCVVFKISIPYGIWLLISLGLFWIPSLSYEWFFVADTSILAIRSRPLRWVMLRLQRIPFWLRVCIFFGVWFSLLLIPFWLAGVPIKYVLLVVLGLYSVHLLVVSANVGIKRFDWWFANRAMQYSRKSLVIRFLLGGLAINFVLVLLLIIATISSVKVTESSLIFNLVMGVCSLSILVFNGFLILKIWSLFKRILFDRRVRNLRLPNVGKAPPIS